MSARCKQEIYRGTFSRQDQCSRQAKRDGYCNQHHPDTVKARKEKSHNNYVAKKRRENKPWHLLAAAEQRIKALEEALNALQTPKDEVGDGARYVLCPGLVCSITDGDVHYISASALAKLYGVRLGECAVASAYNFRERPGDIYLHPQSDGDYTLKRKIKK